MSFACHRIILLHSVISHILLKYKYTRHSINTQDKCVFWASIGECEKNPVRNILCLLCIHLMSNLNTNPTLYIYTILKQGFMHTDCMLACQKCDKLLRAPEPVKEGNSQCSTSAGDSAFKKKL